MVTVEQLIATLDGDEGSISQAEWIGHLHNCAGFAHYLADNVDENGALRMDVLRFSRA